MRAPAEVCLDQPVKPETMTATQVMVRLSTKPDPRALEGQIGPDIGWRRTEFWSVMPGLKYLAAIELDDHAAAEQHKAQIDSSSKLERELAVTKNYLEKTEQRASALLAIVGPRMDEVTRCKKEPYSACDRLNEMAASGKYQMWGYPRQAYGRAGDSYSGLPMPCARRERIDSHLFWDGLHRIDKYGHVVTRDNSVVFGDVRFLTEEIDAALAQDDAAGSEAEPARSRGRPGVREISIELYEARRAKGLALEHDKLAEALQIYREWPSDKSESKPQAKTIAGHITKVWRRDKL